MRCIDCIHYELCAKTTEFSYCPLAELDGPSEKDNKHKELVEKVRELCKEAYPNAHEVKIRVNHSGIAVAPIYQCFFNDKGEAVLVDGKPCTE